MRKHAIIHLIVMIFACLLSSHLYAQQTVNNSSAEWVLPPDEDVVNLSEIIVIGRGDLQLGIADSASQGNVGQEQLRFRPMIRSSEVLETVPGLIVTQHSGEGKANQYYLRGFNLDHGTDFLTQVDGVPLNFVSHAHGQGYTDTGFLIPELIHTIKYQKGVYYAENGDFASAGAANIQYNNTLPTRIAKFESGSFDYYRGLLASSQQMGEGNFLYALEGLHNDGPFQRGDDYRKGNAVLRYSRELDHSGWSATFMGYKANWDSTDQIPKRAVDSGLVDRFGLIGPTDGGNSQRYSLTTEWHQKSDVDATTVMAYGLYYDLDLFSNFTYFLANPTQGDQFNQADRRWVFGLKTNHTFFHHIGKAESESTIGLQIRNDSINNGLFLTQDRKRYATTREDEIQETSLGLYTKNKTRWNDWLRSNLGLRFDNFRFDVDSNRSENSGVRMDGIVSYKGGIVLGPWVDTELYLNGGLGFHSNDARGVNTRVDPTTGLTTDADGLVIKRADPLVRTYGTEVGVRTAWIEDLQSTLVLWLLDIDSELVFVGDAGTTEAGRPSRRYGIEFSNYYSPMKWLTFDADFSFSKSRFRDHANDPNTNLSLGRYIPGSVETVITAGATVHNLQGFFGGLRLRYFGPRALIEDNSVRSESTVLLSTNVGYAFNKTWVIQMDVFNLLNRKDSSIDYFYTSRLSGEAAEGIDDVHIHPIEPMSVRVGLTAKF